VLTILLAPVDEIAGEEATQWPWFEGDKLVMEIAQPDVLKLQFVPAVTRSRQAAKADRTLTGTFFEPVVLRMTAQGGNEISARGSSKNSTSRSAGASPSAAAMASRSQRTRRLWSSR